MPSASATESTAALVPTFDFGKAVEKLSADKTLNLTDVLASIATLPEVDPAKQPKKATAVDLVTDTLMQAIAAIPNVFGKVKPTTRRALSGVELARLRDEKVEVDAAEKALKARKTEIHKLVSVHFDVVAEKAAQATEETRRNKDGHYLLAAPGNPETAVVKEGKSFTREKAKDTVTYSMDKLLALLEAEEITRQEFLALTSAERFIDPDKIQRAFLSNRKRARTQEILNKIADVKRGTLSIHLR